MKLSKKAIFVWKIDSEAFDLGSWSACFGTELVSLYGHDSWSNNFDVSFLNGVCCSFSYSFEDPE